MEKTVLVTGATGKLGEPTARHLQKAGYHVRVFSRNEERARKLFGDSFEIAVGDVSDVGSLEKAMKGCQAVHLGIVGDHEQRGVQNAVQLAKQEGLELITFISGTNNAAENEWFYITRMKRQCEKMIHDSGIPYIIFCPTAAMDNVQMCVQGKRAVVFGRQPRPYHFFAGDDFGRMVAAAYQTDEALYKRFFIHGPEPILIHDAVRRYCAVFHPEIKKVTTIPLWLGRSLAAVTGNKEIKLVVDITTFYQRIGELGDTTEANQLLGAPTTTFDAWLEKKKAQAHS